MDVAAILGRLNRPNHVNVLRSLKEAGFPSAIELLATYEAGASNLASWLRGAEINHDRNLRLQYLAAQSLNRRSETSIYDSMTRFGQPLGEPFTGSRELIAELNRAVDARTPLTECVERNVTTSL
jgi:spermidine synthase